MVPGSHGPTTDATGAPANQLFETDRRRRRPAFEPRTINQCAGNGGSGGDSDAAHQGFGSYSAGAARVHNHSVPEFASFFGPLELVPPGVVDAREWRPDWEQAVHLPPRDGQVIVGVARVG